MATNASFTPTVDVAAIAIGLSSASRNQVDDATFKEIIVCELGLAVALLLHRIFLNAFDDLRPRSHASGPWKSARNSKETTTPKNGHQR
jgi:hypothetical protein